MTAMLAVALVINHLATGFPEPGNCGAIKGAGMAHWREALFAVMSRNSGRVAGFFQLPNNRVIELGTQVQI